MPSQGELAHFAASSDNNDDSTGFKLHSVTAKVCEGPVTTRTLVLRVQINRSQHISVCKQRHGLFVVPELHRINAARATEAEL